MKKLIALLLTLSMSVSMVAYAEETATTADDDTRHGAGQEYEGVDIDSFFNTDDPIKLVGGSSQISYSDIDDADFLSTAVLLNELGIMFGKEDGKFLPDDMVTRGELVETALRICNADVEFQASVSEASYYDVTKEENPYVYAASALGIADGYPNGSFQPNKNATFNEIMKVLVYSAGYGILAEIEGGWPMGVYSVASSLDLMDFEQTDGGMTRENFAKLIYELLESPACIIDDISEYPNRIYSEVDNVLSYYHKIYKSEGIVESNGITSINGGSATQGVLDINGQKYYDKNEAYADFLGYKVNFWYKDKEFEENTLVAIRRHRDVEELVVLARNEPKFENGSLTYFNDKKQKKSATIKKVFDVINNGVFFSDYNKNSFNIPTGKITLISNDNTKNYSLVKIDTFENFVVGGVSNVNNKVSISTKYNSGTIEIDLNNTILELEDRNGRVSYKKTIEGTSDIVYDFSSIKSDSIISVSASKTKTAGKKKHPSANAEYVKIYISDARLDGEISVISDNEIGIGDTKYRVSKSNLFDDREMRKIAGASGTFYFDIAGEIVGYSASADEDGYQYGYVINAYADENDEEFGIKLMTTEGKFIKLTAKKDVRINGAKKSYQQAYDILKASANAINGFTVSQVIKYIAKDDTIKRIQTIDAGNVDNTVRVDNDQLIRQCGPTAFSTYNVSQHCLRTGDGTGAKLAYAAPKVYFHVPSTETRNEEDYIVKKSIGGVSNDNVVMELYDVNDALKPAVAVRYLATIEPEGLVTGRQNMSFPVVYMDSYQEYDETLEEVVIKMNFVTGLDDKTFYSKNLNIADGLKRGDLVTLKGNQTTNEVKEINLFGVNLGVSFSATSIPNIDDVNEALSDYYRFAEAYMIDGKNCIIQNKGIVDSATGKRANQMIMYLTDVTEVQKGGVIVYDATENKSEPVIRTGTYNDIKTVLAEGTGNGSKILVNSLTENLQWLVIYNGY